jgi:hypothetical protein
MPYTTAMACSSRLLSNVKIIERINSLLETGGFTDTNVDKQHLFLINQHADLKTKMNAIKEFNTLKGRIKTKIEHSGFIDIPYDKQAKANEAIAVYIGDIRR